MPQTPLTHVAKPTRVIKKLMPQEAGAQRRAAEFGDKLLCVRYRVDRGRSRRQTTVEIVVDEAPTLAGLRIGQRIAWAEKDLRLCVKETGGKWGAAPGLPPLPLGSARQLGLEERIVGCPG